MGIRTRRAEAEALPVHMDPAEWGALEAVLTALHPRFVLEWGSGGSTKAILRAAPSIERMVSIEHDAGWAERVREHVTDPRLELHHVAPDRPMPPGVSRKEREAWDRRAEDDLALMASYVARPRTLGLAFDLVLVDGRARNFWLPEGFDLLRPGGVLVLHDAQREYHHPVVRGLGRAVFLSPWKRGQICLVRKPDVG